MHASSSSSIPQQVLDFPFARVSTFLAYFTRDLEEINLLFCTGAMISSNLVLTAANCVFGLERPDFTGVQVVLASTHLSRKPVFSKIRCIYYYPGYAHQHPSYSLDVAIVLVSIISNFLYLN